MFLLLQRKPHLAAFFGRRQQPIGNDSSNISCRPAYDLGLDWVRASPDDGCELGAGLPRPVPPLPRPAARGSGLVFGMGLVWQSVTVQIRRMRDIPTRHGPPSTGRSQSAIARSDTPHPAAQWLAHEGRDTAPEC